jgi:hypothetical protein
VEDVEHSDAVSETTNLDQIFLRHPKKTQDNRIIASNSNNTPNSPQQIAAREVRKGVRISRQSMITKPLGEMVRCRFFRDDDRRIVIDFVVLSRHDALIHLADAVGGGHDWRCEWHQWVEIAGDVNGRRWVDWRAAFYAANEIEGDFEEFPQK